MTLCKLLSGLFALVAARSAARRGGPVRQHGRSGPDEGLRPLQVGDRCLIDGGTPKVVIIDSVEHFGWPDCYGATYLTGPKPGSFTVALKRHLRFFYPESEAGSHKQSELPGFEPVIDVRDARCCPRPQAIS
jgi:hypothetical protein